MTDQDSRASALSEQVQRSWRTFTEVFEPLRADLYRYCRYLTRSAWDAEDLVQDTLARGFATLAKMGALPAQPRAWILRVASNLWIDRVRRATRERALPTGPESATVAEDPQAVREAAGTLLVQLAPQERAAIVLKEVFGLSLDEIAGVLSTTVGAVKAALHRGRERLVEPEAERARVPVPGAIEAFCAAFNAADVDALAAVLLQHSVVEVVGATVQYGPEAARQTVLPGMLFGSACMAEGFSGLDPKMYEGVLATTPRVEARFHRDRWVLVHWYAHTDGEAVRAVTELDLEGEHVARLRNYFFTPELIAEVCDELGLPHRSNGVRWCVAD